MKHNFYIILIILLGFYACQTRQEVASNQTAVTEEPDQEGWNATLTSTSDGNINSKIKYVYMQRFSNKKLVKFFQGVHIDFYNLNGEHTTNIYSDEAVLHENNKNIDLVGNVSIHSDNGFKLYSEKVSWKESEGKILSDELVTIITAENDTINGIGFESDKSFRNWFVTKPTGISQKKVNFKKIESSSKDTGEGKK